MRSQVNARIHAVMTMVVVFAAIDKVCDRVSLEHHLLFGSAKDMAAGAVLIASAAAAFIGTIILLPPLVRMFL